MVKYCKSCGAEYKGDYCDKCGYGKPAERSKTFDKYKSNRQRKEEKLAAAAEREAALQKKGIHEKSKMTKSQIVIVVCVLAAVAAVVVWALWNAGVIGAGDKTEPIVDYFTAIAENDYDKYVSSMPKAIAKTYDDYVSENGLSKDTFVKESYSDYHAILGESFTAKVTCGREEELSAEEIAQAENDYKSNFGDDIRIKEAYAVSVEVKFTGDLSEQTYNYDAYVAHIGWHWYIINMEDYYENE